MEIKTCFILTIFCFILAGESIKLTFFLFHFDNFVSN